MEGAGERVGVKELGRRYDNSTCYHDDNAYYHDNVPCYQDNVLPISSSREREQVCSSYMLSYFYWRDGGKARGLLSERNPGHVTLLMNL